MWWWCRRHGEAFWIYTQGSSDFQGAISVKPELSTGLDFGRSLQEVTIKIRNSGAVPVTLDLRLIDVYPEGSVPAAAGLGADRAGRIVLSYWDKFTTTTSLPVWQDFRGPLSLTGISPQSEFSVRFAVDRSRFAPSTNSSPAASYQGMLQISCPQLGTVSLVPASAFGMPGQRTLGKQQNGDTRAPLASGLWLGSVILTNVSHPVSVAPLDPQPTGAPFQFTLILHVDTNGQARLLQQVMLMYRSPKYQTNNGATVKIQDGSYALVTDDSLLANYTGPEYVDATRKGRRFSSCVFGFREPIPMSAEPSGVLYCAVSTEYDDPLNPFRHLYHPDHDNLINQTWAPLSVSRTNTYPRSAMSES